MPKTFSSVHIPNREHNATFSLWECGIEEEYEKYSVLRLSSRLLLGKWEEISGESKRRNKRGPPFFRVASDTGPYPVVLCHFKSADISYNYSIYIYPYNIACCKQYFWLICRFMFLGGFLKEKGLHLQVVFSCLIMSESLSQRCNIKALWHAGFWPREQ